MIYYLLAAFGLAYIVGFARISLRFRTWLGGTPAKPPNPLAIGGAAAQGTPAVPGKLGPFGDFICEMLECPACFGFWIGFVSAIAGMPCGAPEPFPPYHGITWPITLGCITSGSNFILSRLTKLI